MSVFLSTPPKIKKNNLIKWLNSNYNFLNKKKLILKELNSERDKNFLLTCNNEDRFVLKISNTLESKKILDLQDYVLSTLNKRSSIKKIIPKKIHKSIKLYLDENNCPCSVRILSYIKGMTFANSTHSKELECSLGSYIGILSKELQNLGHEAAHRTFEWDPSSIGWINDYLNLFKSKQKKLLKKIYVNMNNLLIKI